ncbi:MAG: ABC transporter permease [Acidobacteriota bacterium]
MVDREGKVKSFVLADNNSPGDISSLLKEITLLDKGSEILVDFKNVVSYTPPVIALIGHLRKERDNIELQNISEDAFKFMEMFPGKPESGDQGESVDPEPVRYSGFKKFRKELKIFLVLFLDEFYYLYRFFTGRGGGVYPGEIRKQMFLMGYRSFPIVSLITFLIGVTISISSAEQLNQLGANIYLADLVGFGMVRELVPLMTGIILAGKIGASITAEISSMDVMEEIDAIRTMGLIPEKFIMVPKLISITIMIPLLVAIADFVGILGGILVGKILSGIQPSIFLKEVFSAIGLSDFFIGLIKTMVFGWIIVVCSGYKGFTVKKSAEGVGNATTESVVLSVSLIIFFDCIFAILFY